MPVRLGTQVQEVLWEGLSDGRQLRQRFRLFWQGGFQSEMRIGVGRVAAVYVQHAVKRNTNSLFRFMGQ